MGKKPLMQEVGYVKGCWICEFLELKLRSYMFFPADAWYLNHHQHIALRGKPGKYTVNSMYVVGSGKK